MSTVSASVSSGSNCHDAITGPVSPTTVITVHLDEDSDYMPDNALQLQPLLSDSASPECMDDGAGDDGLLGDMVDEEEPSPIDEGQKDERLTHWQNQIRQNVRGSYYTVGEALFRVLHKEKLLKTSVFIKWAHASFGLTRSTAYEYIRAYRIVQLLQAQDPSLPVPSTLSHFRVFNKTKLKDGGAEVARLWRTILEELPPDSHQKPRTAKEVLSKGKEIMEREKLGDHAQRTNGLLPGRSPVLGGRRQRTAAHHYDAAGWDQQPLAPQAKRGCPVQISANGVVAENISVSPSLFRRRSLPANAAEFAGQSDFAGSQNQMNSQRAEPEVAGASSVRWASGGRNGHRQSYPATHPAPRRRQRSQSHATGGEVDESGEPPALIPLSARSCNAATVLGAHTVLSMARTVVRQDRFNISLTYAQTPDEANVLALAGARYSVYSSRNSDFWRGCVWGNFSGPLADEHFDAAQCIHSAVEKFDCGEFDEAVFLTSIDFGKDWFQKLLQYPHCFLKRMVPCVTECRQLCDDRPANNGDGNGTSDGELVNQSCAVFYLGNNGQKFVDVFRGVAVIPGANTWCNYSSEG